eukprot:PhF_6_TR26967/c0_g1_i1/m.39336
MERNSHLKLPSPTTVMASPKLHHPNTSHTNHHNNHSAVQIDDLVDMLESLRVTLIMRNTEIASLRADNENLRDQLHHLKGAAMFPSGGPQQPTPRTMVANILSAESAVSTLRKGGGNSTDQSFSSGGGNNNIPTLPTAVVLASSPNTSLTGSMTSLSSPTATAGGKVPTASDLSDLKKKLQDAKDVREKVMSKFNATSAVRSSSNTSF